MLHLIDTAAIVERLKVNKLSTVLTSAKSPFRKEPRTTDFLCRAPAHTRTPGIALTSLDHEPTIYQNIQTVFTHIHPPTLSLPIPRRVPQPPGIPSSASSAFFLPFHKTPSPLDAPPHSSLYHNHPTLPSYSLPCPSLPTILTKNTHLTAHSPAQGTFTVQPDQDGRRREICTAKDR